MSDFSEFWQEEKQAFKERCIKRNAKYEPQLQEIGAIYKADGIYELDGYFLYPTKGFAMSKTNAKKKMKLDKFINKKLNLKEQK